MSKDIVNIKESKTSSNNLVVNLTKEYEFEDSKISSVNLTNISNLTGDDIMRIQQSMVSAGTVITQLELDPQYCLMVAAKASDIPFEFFKQLNIKDATKVKNAVSAYFFVSEA